MATTYFNTPAAGAQMPMQVGPNKAYFACNIANLKTSFGGFVINDTVTLVQIPNWAMLTDFYIDYAALDSSTGLVTSIGDNVSASHGGVGAGGFMAGLTLGRSSTAGTVRAGGTGFVHGVIPWIYGVPYANVPVSSSTTAAGIWLLLTVTTAATGTAATTGIISGWAEYTLLTPGSSISSGTGATQSL
jgi:hypothetical protein